MESDTLEQLRRAADIVYCHMPPSAQLQWPLLDERCGCSVIVKHENHNPTGAFKVRGGLVYLQRLTTRDVPPAGLVAATRGNHGQSVALAAREFGLPCTVVVPEGNSGAKNRAMAGFGADLVVAGADFDEALAVARNLANDRDWHLVPSFHHDLVDGVASYALELFEARPRLERVYVPIGLGSGLCGLVRARNALGLNTDIVGVVASAADCYALSLEAGHCVSTERADTIADGLAVRIPNPQALDMIRANVSRIVRVQDTEILAAMAAMFDDTHNVVEGAGAAALAAVLQEKSMNAGREIAVVATGANVDSAMFTRALGVHEVV